MEGLEPKPEVPPIKWGWLVAAGVGLVLAWIAVDLAFPAPKKLRVVLVPPADGVRAA